MRFVCPVLLAFTVLACLAAPAFAAPSGGAGGGVCQSAAARAEASRHLPDAFLSAIARVETGRPDAATGIETAWPWSVNAEGLGTFYASKAAAIQAVRALQARGVASIDVGCLQVNLKQHPAAFNSLEQAFDPEANAAYAADFLQTLFDQTGSWPLAAAAYHSLTPGIGSAYQQRVLAEWAIPQNEPRSPARRARQQHLADAAQHQEPSRLAPGRIADPPIIDRPPAAAPAITARLDSSAPATFPLARPSGATGRGLAAYRLLPTRLAFHPPPAPG